MANRPIPASGSRPVLARVLLAQDRPVQALTVLARILAAVTQSRTGNVIEIGALRALALAARGDHASGANRTGAAARARQLGLIP